MKHKAPTDDNELLIRLYALTHEQPIEHFQNAALELLKTILPFDAAIWGAATAMPEGIDIHSFHLHNKTPEMVTCYEEVKHLDAASSGMFHKSRATQAFDTHHFFSERHHRPIRDFMSKFEQPHFLLTTDLSPTAHANSSLLHWVTLYRAKQTSHYSATDVKRMHVYAPHFKQALALNRSAHLSQMASRLTHSAGAHKPLHALAIVDTRGHIYGRDANFMALLSKASGEDCACSHVLPASLTMGLEEGKRSFRWRQLVVCCQVEHGLMVLSLREETMADSLTKREKEIAMLVANGRTYKQVAASLGNSPHTVRSQLQTIYNKMQVNSIAELVRAMPVEE